MTSAKFSSRAIVGQPAMAAVTALLTAAGLPTADLQPEHLRHFFTLGPAHAPLGVVGVQIVGTAGLLRSLAVSSASRSGGVGSQLVGHAELHARANGVHSLFLLTTTAEAFFAKLGYLRIERSAAPPAICATEEFASICPASSAFMVKRLA